MFAIYITNKLKRTFWKIPKNEEKKRKEKKRKRYVILPVTVRGTASDNLCEIHSINPLRNFSR
jgi:hypothetical protein